MFFERLFNQDVVQENGLHNRGGSREDVSYDAYSGGSREDVTRGSAPYIIYMRADVNFLVNSMR